MYNVSKVEDLVVAVVKRNEREIRITGDAKKAFDKFNKSSVGKGVVAYGVFLTGGVLSYIGVSLMTMGIAPVALGLAGLGAALGASTGVDVAKKKQAEKELKRVNSDFNKKIVNYTVITKDSTCTVIKRK